MPHDDPTEHIQEEIHEHAHGHGDGGTGPRWIGIAALTAALLAALAAIGGSLASTRLTDAMRDQIRANDLWGEYQANAIKEKEMQTRAIILEAQGRTLSKDEAKDLEKYGKRNEIREKALEKEEESEHSLKTHETLERGVTFFHISIAIVAVAVLTRRKSFYFVSVGTGTVGVVFLVLGTSLHLSPPAIAESEHATTAAHASSTEHHDTAPAHGEGH